MQFTTTLALLIAGTTASPLGIGLGVVSVNVASSSGLLSVNTGGSSAGAAVAPGAVGASTITAAPTSTAIAQPTMPSTFSAPVQGSGVLSLKNLPALPPVLDKTFSGVLGAVYGLLSGTCSSNYKCTISIAGSIQSLLVDGDQYTMNSTIQAWCAGGHCYGSANVPITASAPFTITCDQVTGTQACSGTISGAVEAIFTNGQQVEAWGWLTPAGYCQNGLCTASITAFGDPMY